jgi:hypothetical protein
MSGLYHWKLIAGAGGVPTSASPAPKLVPEPGGMHGNRTVAAATAGCAGIPRNILDDHRSMKKNFFVMTLALPIRSVVGFFRSFCRTRYLRL